MDVQTAPARTRFKIMGLNLSNRQIGHELDLNKDDVQLMPRQLREGIEAKQPPPLLTGEDDVDARLPAWDDDHHSVCHSRGEYARDDDQ